MHLGNTTSHVRLVAGLADLLLLVNLVTEITSPLFLSASSTVISTSTSANNLPVDDLATPACGCNLPSQAHRTGDIGEGTYLQCQRRQGVKRTLPLHTTQHHHTHNTTTPSYTQLGSGWCAFRQRWSWSSVQLSKTAREMCKSRIVLRSCQASREACMVDSIAITVVLARTSARCRHRCSAAAKTGTIL